MEDATFQKAGEPPKRFRRGGEVKTLADESGVFSQPGEWVQAAMGNMGTGSNVQWSGTPSQAVYASASSLTQK